MSYSSKKQPVYINNIIDKYNEIKKDVSKGEPELEIGVKFKGVGPVSMKIIHSKMFALFKEECNDISIVENLDAYYDGDIRKTIVFSKGVNQKKDIIIRKSRVGIPFIIKREVSSVDEIKAKLSRESLEAIDTSKMPVKFMRFKLRVKFDLIKNGKNWTAELDLIKTVGKNENNLKGIKDTLFKNYTLSNLVDSIEYSAFDECRLEFEFKNEKTDMTLENIFMPVNDLSKKLNVDISAYQNYIFSLARQLISNNKGYLESFRLKSGLKKLLNNVIEIDSNLYYSKVQSKLFEGDYFITDKIDGKRSVLMIKYNSENEEKCNAVILNDKLTVLKEYRFSKKDRDAIKYITLDCEMISSGDNTNLFVFDVMLFEGERLVSKTFEERFQYLEPAVSKVNKILSGINSRVKCYAKQFIRPVQPEVKNTLTEFYNKDREYEIDGIILTPAKDEGYLNMIGYKWKPAEHSTIDFYIKKAIDVEGDGSKSKDKYILFSGISKRDMRKFNMSLIAGYDRIINTKALNGDLMPIQFSPGNNPKNFNYTNTTGTEIDGKIGEFGWDQKKQKWVLKRIREDRDVELARGEYYGNYFKVAESIWYSINNPLKFEDLFLDKGGYFMEHNSEKYKAARNFNSFVKAKTMENIISKGDIVCDLAAGKGQDMFRFMNMGVSSAVFVDNDKNALQEIIKRKHTSKLNSSMKVTTCEVNLMEPWKENKDKIEKCYGEKIANQVKVVICNFAIHYFSDSTNSMINILELCKYMLTPGGMLIITCFDGEKVKELCGENGWDSVENGELKYSIKKVKNNSSNSVGEKIKLILPFSRGEYYEEYIVNLNWLKNTFEDNGFGKETIGSFKNFLTEWESKNDNLSEDDKTFVSLYSYAVFRKNSNNSIVAKSNVKSFLKDDGDYTEKKGSREEDIQLLENLPLSNYIIVRINDSMGEESIKEIKKNMQWYGYRDLSENRKLRKKIFLIMRDNEFSKKLNKIKQATVISIENNKFIYENYFKENIQWLSKIHVGKLVFVKNETGVIYASVCDVSEINSEQVRKIHL